MSHEIRQLPPSMSPNVAWRRVVPADVISGLKALGCLDGEGIRIAYRGEDVHSLLQWAFTELELAEKSSVEDDRRRHASHVVTHAKKAIDGLFDAYLERDFLDARLGPRATFSRKMSLLRMRHNVELPWRLIPAIVGNPRNTSEHQRIAPTVEEAGIAAEAARVIVRAMKAASDPLNGHAILGTFPGGTMRGPWGVHVHVDSFPEAFGWFWRGSDGVPRTGVGVSDGRQTAEVQYSNISDFTEEQHMDLLATWDVAYHAVGWRPREVVGRHIRLAGLDQPPADGT